MTAIVAILNKSAAAISADSAASVSAQTKKKFYNNANKVFNLAIGRPIGIMIYNNAEFLGIPWEALVKEYRKYSNNKGFDTVEAYRDHFLRFLTSHAVQWFSGNEEEVTVTVITRGTLDLLERELISDLNKSFGVTKQEELSKKLDPLTQHDKIVLFRRLLEKNVDVLLNRLSKTSYCVGFNQEDVSKIEVKHEQRLRHEIGRFLTALGLQLQTDLQEKMRTTLVQACIKSQFISSFTGLVFTGFGESQIFPAISSMSIGGFINNKLRYAFETSDSITVLKPAGIYPFAQTQIMRTFIQGIDPEVNARVPAFLESALIEFKEHVLKRLHISSPSEATMKDDLEKAIPLVLKSLVTKLEQSRRNLHDEPMLATISSLSKEDLTAMAESLIHTTSLHKRASFSDESVGGPVDVAVITKGDGFIWVKRKHYFDPALNLNYTSKFINSKI